MTIGNILDELELILKRPTTHFNLSVPLLVEKAVRKKEGVLSATGALTLITGEYTGRSPQDKFIVRDEITETSVAWGNVNAPLQADRFSNLLQKVLAYLRGLKEIYVFDGYVGADPKYRMAIRVVNEYAWQNLFAHQLFIRPQEQELAAHQRQFTVIAVPGLKADPKRDGTNSEAFIVVSFAQRLILIGGTAYAGEIKKSVFSVLNYYLPQAQILPMHCSATVGAHGKTALFFGLSGTGKTTLSADPHRSLLGDDEHGWSAEGIFNLEGGCYAKCINLSREHEPQIWDAIRFGTVLENVVLSPLKREPDYEDASLTENTRAAYPLHHIPRRVEQGSAGHPQAIIFLTADAFGVLPPISILEKEQIIYHFLSGYTSKLAGTERGVQNPEATFSACFGEPFLPLPPIKYAEMLSGRIAQHRSPVYLINTGWSGGAFGEGKRIPLPYTRRLVNAALAGEFKEAATRIDPVFGLRVPLSCPGVPAEILDPRKTWGDPQAYDQKARELAKAFQVNFSTKYAGVDPKVLRGGPQIG